MRISVDNRALLGPCYPLTNYVVGNDYPRLTVKVRYAMDVLRLGEADALLKHMLA